MGEVHIEFSSGVKFAPFNGAYPEHAAHMKAANLDVNHNMWYDVYDHNDPHKTRENWSLLPESEYEDPWYPAGSPCEFAVPRNKPGSVKLPDVGTEGSNMQSFNMDQLRKDAEKASSSTSSPSKTVPPPPIPAASISANAGATAVKGKKEETEQRQQQVEEEEFVFSTDTPQGKITLLLKQFVMHHAGGGTDLSDLTSDSFSLIVGDGRVMNTADLMASASATGSKLWAIDKIEILPGGSHAWSVFYATEGNNEALVSHYTALLQASADSKWVLTHAQKSTPRVASEVPNSIS